LYFLKFRNRGVLSNVLLRGFDIVGKFGGNPEEDPVRKAKLLSTVAVALLLSAGAASAQGMNNDKPDRAPAAQQNAPAEKVAPSMKQGEHKSPTTAGQASSESKPGKARETTGQSPKSEDHEKATMDKDSKSAPAGGKSEIRSRSEQNEHGRNAKSGKASETTGQSKSEDHEKSSMDKDDKSEFRSRSEQNERNEHGMKGRSSSQTTTEKDRTTTGQGAASGAAKLSTEQRTKITSIIREHKVEPAHLNVSVRVGTRIPRSVHLYALPEEVVTVYPEWRGYDYILVGDEIVVINPRTHEIVAILEA
jgi:hypothetical protein